MEEETMSVEDAYNYRRVNDLICTAGVINEQQLRMLGAEGYAAVISLLPDNSEYAVPDEEEIVLKQGLGYRYIPVDFSNPTDNDYAEFVDAMKEYEGQKIIVHCAANFRVSAFFSIYALQHLGWSKQQTDDLIQSLWNPAEHPPWESFIENQLVSEQQ